MTPMNESLLKADKLGRLRDTSEQKKTMVQAYRASGLNAPQIPMQGAWDHAYIEALLTAYGSHYLVRSRKNRVRFSGGLPPRLSPGRRVP